MSSVLFKERFQGREVEVVKETKPWGYYEVLLEGDGYKIKKIVICPGGKLSMQKHENRSEFWMMLSGVAIITHNDVRMFFPGDYEYIPAGDIHRIENPSEIMDVIFYEIQTGKILNENDIERINDIYGRS
jgi:mannose-1-phosphate guanylyltransferase